MKLDTDNDRQDKPDIQALIQVLKYYKEDKTAQAICLQTYIQQYGPIPNEYGDTIKELLI